MMQLTTISHSLLSIRFQTCARKCIKRQPRVERAVGEIIAEVHIPPTATDTTFEHFLQRNEDGIVNVIQQHVERYGYAKRFYLNVYHHHHLLHYAYIARNTRNRHYRYRCLC